METINRSKTVVGANNCARGWACCWLLFLFFIPSNVGDAGVVVDGSANNVHM